MFENLTDRLEGVFKKLRGHGILTEENIEDAMREVRMALLDADVNFKVAREFVATIAEQAIGREVAKSLSPGQQVIKIVHEELVSLLGGDTEQLRLDGRQPVIIMMAGLQGSGKTTTSGKLARMLKGKGRKPYLVPADVYRPAAIEQLQVLGGRIDVPVHPSTTDTNPVDICRQAVDTAKVKGYDTLIIDTAGRLHVDEVLMDELKEIQKAVQLSEILFVADAMTGQDAVTVADKFNQALEISGGEEGFEDSPLRLGGHTMPGVRNYEFDTTPRVSIRRGDSMSCTVETTVVRDRVARSERQIHDDLF
jgi:signal recognition particle subunit SRP54